MSEEHGAGPHLPVSVRILSIGREKVLAVKLPAARTAADAPVLPRMNAMPITIAASILSPTQKTTVSEASDLMTWDAVVGICAAYIVITEKPPALALIRLATEASLPEAASHRVRSGSR